MLIAGALVVGFPYLVRTVLGLSARHYGAAESAMGVAAILGGALVTLLAGRLRPRHLAPVFVLVGFCLLPAGAAFMLPLGALARYWVLLVLFCGCQLGCSVFSIYAATQVLYGALFDRLAPQWVLLPSGLLLCAVGLFSAGFFRRMDAPPAS